LPGSSEESLESSDTKAQCATDFSTCRFWQAVVVPVASQESAHPEESFWEKRLSKRPSRKVRCSEKKEEEIRRQEKACSLG